MWCIHPTCHIFSLKSDFWTPLKVPPENNGHVIRFQTFLINSPFLNSFWVIQQNKRLWAWHREALIRVGLRWDFLHFARQQYQNVPNDCVGSWDFLKPFTINIHVVIDVFTCSHTDSDFLHFQVKKEEVSKVLTYPITDEISKSVFHIHVCNPESQIIQNHWMNGALCVCLCMSVHFCPSQPKQPFNAPLLLFENMLFL